MIIIISLNSFHSSAFHVRNLNQHQTLTTTTRSSTTITSKLKPSSTDVYIVKTKIKDTNNCSYSGVRTELFGDHNLLSSDEVVNSSSNNNTLSNKQVLGMAATVLYSGVSIIVGIIAVFDLGADWFGFSDFTAMEYVRDMGSSLLCAVLGTVWVKLWTTTTKNELITPLLTRKIIHTTSAPLFMLFWPIFSSSEYARFFACVVPALNALKLYLAGSDQGGGDKELAQAVSRSGNIEEALGGPFLYTLILLSATILSWRSGLPGIVAVSTMAAGDGMADIVGRRFGKNNKWFFSEKKSIAGSMAFCVSAFLVSMVLILWLDFSTEGIDALAGMGLDCLAIRLGVISSLCTAVELVPGVDDNWTVPLSAAVLTQILFSL